MFLPLQALYSQPWPGPAVSPGPRPGLCEPLLPLGHCVEFLLGHTATAATSPGLPGSLAPFPPYLPQSSLTTSSSPPFLASGLLPCTPFALFFLSASATSLPPRSLLGRLQPTQPDWTELGRQEKVRSAELTTSSTEGNRTVMPGTCPRSPSETGMAGPGLCLLLLASVLGFPPLACLPSCSVPGLGSLSPFLPRLAQPEPSSYCPSTVC